eukprot:8575121-Pyramimonas_sp.AAC.2
MRSLILPPKCVTPIGGGEECSPSVEVKSAIEERDAEHVEVKSAIEERNAEHVIINIQMHSTLAEKDKRVAMAVLDKCKGADQAAVRYPGM